MSFINRNRKGKFVSLNTLLDVWVDHIYSVEFIGTMTIKQFKSFSKRGGQFITSIKKK